MSNRGRVGIAVVALLLGIVGAYFYFTSGDDPAPEETSDRDAAPANDFERWALLDERPPPPVPAPATRGRRDDPRWAERRARWQERWRRAVEIVPLGPSEPTLTPEVIREALAPGREALRACMSEAGGWRALRDARREERRAEREAEETSGEAAQGEAAQGEGRRRRRRSRGRVSFDVAPDGRVDPETVTFEPPMPEAFDHCFRAYFSAPTLEGAGADGARVELPMGGPGRRRRGGASGDAGVPSRRRWRDDARRGERGAQREGGERSKRVD